MGLSSRMKDWLKQNKQTLEDEKGMTEKLEEVKLKGVNAKQRRIAKKFLKSRMLPEESKKIIRETMGIDENEQDE